MGEDAGEDKDLQARTLYIVKEAAMLAGGWWLLVYFLDNKVVPPQKLLIFLSVYIPTMILLSYGHKDLSGQIFIASAAALGSKMFDVVKV